MQMGGGSNPLSGTSFNFSEVFVMTSALYQDDLPDDIKFNGSVAVDTETLGLNYKRDRLCLVQLCSADGEVHIVQINKDDPAKAKNLKKLFEDESVLKIFHFARFDISMIKQWMNANVFPIYCTKIVSKLVRTYTDKHGLKTLCHEILHTDISKQEQSSYWGREQLTPEQLKYAAGDVIHLHKIKNELDKMLEREGKTQLAQNCFSVLRVVSQLELNNFSPEEIFSH